MRTKTEKETLASQVQRLLGEEVTGEATVSGGCIADSRVLQLRSGQRVFAKQARPGQPAAMLTAEAAGLQALRATGTVRVPRVLAASPQVLLLEYIPTGRARPGSYFALGQAVARLHQVPQPAFGFPTDNFLGSSPQSNQARGRAQQDWAVFYRDHRLRFQLTLAQQAGWGKGELSERMTQLLERLPELLSGSEEPPALLHGDLWSGNHLFDQEGAGWVIDPAASHGHREADLAMTTLFGGFPPEFYQGYDAVFPRVRGWEHREPLYHLYHLLNHLNLFGGSYLSSVLAILRRFTR